ncbi:MAG: hypothetical protein JSR21_20770, partial [Proteobacteria bacterium]|nr:hypothetical protein [Pseudomonadota bacterium]
MSFRSPWALAGIGSAAAIVLALLLPDFYVTLGGYVGLAAMVALGLVLLTGISGQTSFGQ